MTTQSLKKALLALFIILFSYQNSRAEHLMGGEITWDCLGTGQFVFTMKIYRDCNGNPMTPGAYSLDVHNCPGLTKIPLNLFSKTDNSPVCNAAGPTITCANPSQGAIEEYIYKSAPIFISGTPPAAGWIFTYDDGVRNAAVTNLVAPNSHGFTLRAKMFAYNGKDMNPCYDSSPEFYEKPKSVLCTGYPYTFNHNAVDDELDSLHFAWAEPLDWFTGVCGFNYTPTCPPALNFTAGYSYNSPLPGPSMNPLNVAAQLNPNTGEISYTSYTQGNFVMVVEVSAFKCGTLVAQVYREIQMVLAVCSDITPGNPNHPPAVVPPFKDNFGNPTLYIDTVYAGDPVDFFIQTTDKDLTPTGSYQNLSITATGQQFDQNFTNSNGVCLKPPCATLTPPPSLLSGQQSLSTEFKWQTTCDHLGFNVGCLSFANVYNFVIKSADDFCPIPGVALATVTIVVLPKPPVAPPLLKCLAVAANGDVTLSWVTKPDTDNIFTSFDIMYSTSRNGPYSIVGNVLNYAQTTYTHVGANATSSNPAYYYVVIHSGCPNGTPSLASDTLQAIQLKVTNPGTGYTKLTWNPTHNPPLSSNSSTYTIYREYPAGTWALLASTTQFTYDDPITVCSANINYRVEVTDSSGCTSVSNVDGNVFNDILVPGVPIMDSVSVDAAGLATVSWLQDTSADAIGYIIYQCNGNICVPIDTVFGISNLNYNSTISANSKSEYFCVAAFDSCGNTSPLSPIHNTVYLTGGLDLCSSSILLNWNAYLNWTGGVSTYEVYASANGGPYALVGSTTSTTFAHTGLTPLTNYCYVIRAVKSGGIVTSSSNSICITAVVAQVPAFQYVRKATVLSANSALLTAYVDTSADIIKYNIYRSEAAGGPYAIVGSVPFSGVPLITYTDNNVSVGERSYYYKVSAVDSCGNDAFISQHGRTIYVSATPNDNLTNSINWNDYEIWLGGVDHYNLYRSVDGVINPVPIAIVPFGQATTYTDNISAFTQASGEFCYYVKAVEGPGNIYGFTDTSYSNLGCALQKPMTFIPNAFHPSGTNNRFAPFTSFVSTSDFSFDIYNRWGERIFHADNPQAGWDGSYKGNDAPEGIYVYFAKIKGTDGTDIERKGTITLLR